MATEELASRLTAALQSGEPMTCGSAPPLKPGVRGDDYPLVRGHMYSVLGFDPKTDNTVRLCANPWEKAIKGQTKLKDVGSTLDGIRNIGDGKLTMSIDNFQKYFLNVEISGQTRGTGLWPNLVRGEIHHHEWSAAARPGSIE